jgi:hypothetical protein
VVVVNHTTDPRSHNHFVVGFNIVTFLPLYLLAQTHGVWFWQVSEHAPVELFETPLSHCSWLLYPFPVPITPSPQYDPLAEQLAFPPPLAPLQDHDHKFVREEYVAALGVPSTQSAVGVVPV